MEGLNTELKTSELCLETYDKETYKKCGYCHQVIEIKKNFKEDTDTCNVCFKLLQKEDKINMFIHIIWKENTKYRVLCINRAHLKIQALLMQKCLLYSYVINSLTYQIEQVRIYRHIYFEL